MAETIWNSAVSVYHFMMDNLVVINILLSLVIVFFQRRSPQTVWTWLLLLYFIPILGFVLYLLIGQDFHKSRMFKAKEIEGEIKYAVRRQEETIYRRRLRLTNPAVARYRDLILRCADLYRWKGKIQSAAGRDAKSKKIYSFSVLYYP